MATPRLAPAAASMTNRQGAAPATSIFRIDILSASPLRSGARISAVVRIDAGPNRQPGLRRPAQDQTSGKQRRCREKPPARAIALLLCFFPASGLPSRCVRYPSISPCDAGLRRMYRQRVQHAFSVIQQTIEARLKECRPQRQGAHQHHIPTPSSRARLTQEPEAAARRATSGRSRSTSRVADITGAAS